jgi:hypothetical protein
MTEEEWLTTPHTVEMFRPLYGTASDRKSRLFVVACCHLIWRHFTHERSRNAVLVAERFADGEVSERDLTRVHSMAMDAIARWRQVTCRGRVWTTFDRDSIAYQRVCFAPVATQSRKPFYLPRSRVFALDPDLDRNGPHLLRDIFGNPFRPVTLDPCWLSETVVALASGIYAERAFDRLPILADALEEAGCDNADVLNHCRGQGPHVRGCWVVDLLLGKE